ncbi:transcriptional regulator family: Fungal Specific TF [Penicillium waksmanii]|uniref:transcriptional regulator family: Fungal Specific TF n=1 Tax=Penicillium waksmanii TaxID=69791 RepID=UPI00254676C6|nr:transcriptional regulator family: Fungal Specific TF [Penicillium waksmanii]KAJ5975922.1 transcriptional regulator family: Fungal Specific TF [Penicillium waksmanii]
MSVSPLRDHIQLDSNEIHAQIQAPNRSQRPKFRASCDPCAASKVRCTKEQHGCSRCTKNGLKCVYGRSQRKGKPPSNKFASTQQQPPPSPPQVPAPSPWPTNREPVHHYPNPHLNTNCIWYRSNMLPKTSSQNQKSDNAMSTEGERNTPSSLNSHQPLPDHNDTPPTSISSGRMSWPKLVDADPSTYSGDLDPLPMTFVPEDPIHFDYDDMDDASDDEADDNYEREGELGRENANEDQHEPCITVACRVLSSLYEFVRCDCVNGHDSNSGSSTQCKDLALAKEDPRSDIVFYVTQSATEEVSRLLNCTGIICAQDSSVLLVLGAILCKILTWYQTLYQSEISRLLSDQAQDAHLTTSIDPHHHSSGGTDGRSKGPRQVDRGDSMYRVPLSIPLNTGGLNLSRDMETKMKAQFLLCQLQTLHRVCQSLNRRAQAAEGMQGEKSLSAGSSAQLLEKVGEFQRVLTKICTQTPEYNS